MYLPVALPAQCFQVVFGVFGGRAAHAPCLFVVDI